MITKQNAIEIIETSLNEIKNKTIQRRAETELLEKTLSIKHATALTGIRRCGKTYLLFQLIQELMQKGENVAYINFENPLFDEDVKQLDVIYTAFLEYISNENKIYFFFDEIQNIKKWERWLALMYEKNIKFFVSGSNASLLAGEFSKSLSGRHKLLRIYPLGFKQFVLFKDPSLAEKRQWNITEKKARISAFLKEYIHYGGFPEPVYNGNRDILKDYFDDILTKDIISRYNIKFKQSLKEIAYFLLANISSPHSLYSLNKTIQARSINTIKNYLMYLEDAYLILKIPFFSFSVKKQLSNPFKIYSVDTGMRNAISFRFSEEAGKLYENIVVVELARRCNKEELFYWKSKKGFEVDFLIKQGTKISQLIQVCYDIKNNETRKRELGVLSLASEEFKCEELIVITEDYDAVEEINKKKIKFIPLWKWLLE